MAWHPDWFRLPGQAVFDREKQHVAAVTRTPCFLDLFVIGFDNRVWSTFWNEDRGWNPDWFPVRGNAIFNRHTQQVTAVSRHEGHLDLYVIGFDNRVWTTFWSEERGEWNEDWFHVPGDAVFDHQKQLVTAVSRHRDQLDLFAIRSDNRVWTTFWSKEGGWHGVWFPVRGTAVFDHETQRVAAVSRAPGQLDLFAVRSSDNRVLTTFWSEGRPDGGWNRDWFPVRGTHVFDHAHQHVAALSRKPGQLDLFVIGFDKRVWTTFWSEGGSDGGWNPDWFPVNGQALFDFQKQRVAAVSRHRDQLDLFAIGPGNLVLTTFWTQGRAWHPEWFPILGKEFDQRQHVAAVSRAPAQLDLFAIDSDNRVSSAFWREFYEPVGGDYLLDVVPADGSPVQAYATHKARASAVARNFALTHLLKLEDQTANEDNTIYLIAHLQAASDDATFSAGQEISKTLAPKVLLRMNPGHGQVGTHYDEFFGSREGDYDMALKGLMVIAYRYQALVGKEGLDHILDRLTPLSLSGPHDEDIESYTLVLTETAPETENHMLMITSTKYLVNQLLYDRVPHLQTYNNNANGLTEWLLGYLQRVAKHDFLEFNSRAYQRLSLHALLNLHEFARDKSIRTAAQILLDYSTVKFAVSSNRLRRVNPFRRKKENTNTPDKLNDLINEDYGGDPLLGFFLAYVGPTGPDGKPLDRFPQGWGFNAVIAGLAAYRPPPAAYALALQRDLPPFQHRFYHGNRPRLPGTNDYAQGGIEIYYRAPSFLLTGGGAFLNSGYGGDEFTGGKETAVAQSTTLIPTRADLTFADLIRFDPYPDERRATNTAVHLGFACGANLRPSDRKSFGDRSTHGPRLAAHRGRLLVGWKASDSEEMVVATVRISGAMGLDGIEQIHGRVVPRGDTTDNAPALASHACRLFLAWKGAGNENLNVMFSDDGGASFRGKKIFGDTSEFSPALASHGGRLFMAWTGEDEHINVAKVRFQGSTAGTFGIERLEFRSTLGATSEHSPALASHNGRLFVAWRGSGNEEINLAFSNDSGATFGGTFTFAETSDYGPALASHDGRLYIAWTGEGGGNLNVARVTLVGNSAGGFGIEGLESKVTLGETSDDSPALTSHAGRLFLGWKGHGNTGLNVRSSRDGTFYSGPWYFSDLGHLGFYVAAYRTPPQHPELLDTYLESLGFVYAMEIARGMTFDQFRAETLQRNPALPAMLDYGRRYEFNAPNGPQFVFWLHPSLATYGARVTRTNEPNPVIDFTTLPLIEGPYLRAPGGHDGLIEVHDPRCPTPLILDYRDAMNPVRHDPYLACAGTWVERAEALSDLAQHLIGARKNRYADATLVDQVAILKQLAEVDGERHGAKLATATQFALARVGVDFNVTADDVNEWIRSPRFEPQLAIAKALLMLLGGRRLRRAVDLDAIVGIYERSTVGDSPRDEGSVQANALKAAVLEGHNRRYADNVRELDALVR